MTQNITFSPKQLYVINKPFVDNVLEVNEGTPRSGKTTAGRMRAGKFYIKTEDENHLITAYNQEQAYKLFIDGEGMGLLRLFDGNCDIRHDDLGDHLKIETPKGVRRIYFKGGGKADSYKSILGASFGSIVFCEIDVIHPTMIQECLRRTYAAKLRWHLADLNPPAPQHPVINDVFNVQKLDWLHWRVKDNPIITPERAEEIRRTCAKSPYLLTRDWEGKRTVAQGVIYSMFNHDRHMRTALEGSIVEMFFTADGGQSDATTCSCNIVVRDKRGEYVLYRAANFYHSGRDTGVTKAMSTYATEISTFIRYCEQKFYTTRSCILVDPACKSLREELIKLGYDTGTANNNSREVVKGKRGIEVGIERCQNVLTDGRFYVIDDPRYGAYDFLREAAIYCRKSDGTPVDMYNHAMDEFRYSVNYFYTTYLV